VLALGAAESVVGITDAFKPYPDRRGMYCPNTVRAVPRVAMGAAAVPLKLVAAR
jgi:chemotaxis protein methyltransferase CheR